MNNPPSKEELSKTAPSVLIQQEDREERERRERERKWRLQEELAFLSYLKMAREEEQFRLESIEQLVKLRQAFYLHFFETEHRKSSTAVNNIRAHDVVIQNFLHADETPEDKAKRQTICENLQLDEKAYNTVAISALNNSKEDYQEVDDLFCGRLISKRLLSRRKEGLEKANRALENFLKGSPDELETVLQNGLVAACYEFTKSLDAVSAIHWAKHAGDIIAVISKHSVLFKNGVNPALLEMSLGVAAMGKIMESGYEALTTMQKRLMEGKPLSQSEELTLQSHVILMQQMDSQRTSGEYQQFFAKYYNPKNGLSREKMQTLVEQVSQAEVMMQLQHRDKEEKMFLLSDPSARKSISETVFRESKTPKKDKEKAPAAPSLQGPK